MFFNKKEVKGFFDSASKRLHTFCEITMPNYYKGCELDNPIYNALLNHSILKVEVKEDFVESYSISVVHPPWDLSKGKPITSFEELLLKETWNSLSSVRFNFIENNKVTAIFSTDTDGKWKDLDYILNNNGFTLKPCKTYLDHTETSKFYYEIHLSNTFTAAELKNPVFDSLKTHKILAVKTFSLGSGLDNSIYDKPDISLEEKLNLLTPKHDNKEILSENIYTVFVEDIPWSFETESPTKEFNLKLNKAIIRWSGKKAVFQSERCLKPYAIVFCKDGKRISKFIPSSYIKDRWVEIKLSD